MVPNGIAESFLETFAGRIDRFAYGLVTGWVIGMGLTWAVGYPLSLRSALLGLCGNLLVVVCSLAIKLRRKQEVDNAP